MSDVKPQFRIGKTQWREWNNTQRNAFNTLMAQGKSFPDAVALASSMVDVFEQFEPKPKKSILDVLEDVVETVADVAEAAAPVITVAKTVQRVTRKKKAK